MKVKRLFLLFFLAQVACLWLSPGRTADPVVEVWQLKQESASFGKITAYLGSDCARADLYMGASHIVAKAPDWKVVAWNDENKGICVDSKTWQKSELDFLGIYLKDIYARSGDKGGRPVRYLGKKAIAFEQVNAENGRAAFLRTDVGTQPRYIKGVARAIASNDFALSEGVAGFCRGFYSTPRVAPVLLGSGTSEDTGEFWCFRTIAIEKKKVPASLFKAPTSFKPAERLQQVLVGSRGANVLLDVLGPE